MKDPEKLKEIVREKYSEIVIGQKSCCSPKNKYNEHSVFNEEYKNLVGYIEDADLNLGCGLPTEHANIKPNGHFCVSDIVLKGELPGKIRNASAMYAGCVSGAVQKEEYLNIIKENGFKNIQIKKERIINVPDAMLLEYVSEEVLTEYRKSGIEIYSITVVASR